MNNRTRLVLVTLLTFLSALCACQKPPRSRGEAVDRMVQLERSGHYDAAIRVVQDWMNQHQNDTSADDFLHLQIAMVYVDKAYHKKSTREESVDNAASHLESALQLHEAGKPEGMDTFLFGIGGAYEILGDLAQKYKCRFYGKA